MNTLPQNYINHIALVLDASGSMSHLASTVITVADAQIKYLARRSQELDQETRVTIYTFSDRNRLQCVVYDKDVLRLPSLKTFYHAGGQTALIDATYQAITDLNKTATLYGDHAFLVYVLTDGEENNSQTTPRYLSDLISSLKDNWTTAVFVPNQNGVFEAKKFGFPPQNIAVWDTSEKGIKEVGEVIRRTTDAYMTMRSTGVRGTRNLFQMDTANITPTKLAQNLSALSFGQYRLFPVRDDQAIADFVEARTKRPYKAGQAYYELTKTETVQAKKRIAIREETSGKVFIGDDARQLLGLPNREVRVAPAHLPGYKIFIQSTSVNRKLIDGTQLLVLS